MDKKNVRSYRTKDSTHSRLISVCKKNKISPSRIPEVLIEKFLRGEIVLTSKDFEV